MEGYTRKQISKIVGMPERAVHYYTEVKVIVPEIDEGHGRGTVRRYSKKNMVELGILKQLSNYGVSISVVENIFRTLRLPVPNKDMTKLEMGGIINLWKGFKPNTYIVLYQEDKIFKHEILLGLPIENGLNEDLMKNSESILIINIGRITALIKDQ